MGARYLGSYIGYDEYKCHWLKIRTETWERNIYTISETAVKYPQESYSAVVHAIQSEWIFLLRVATNAEDVFAVAEKMIWTTFLPRLFFGKSKISHPS